LGRSQNEELDGCGYEDGLEEHVRIRAVRAKNFTRANASCESFLNTLKRQEIYANRYRDFEHLRMNMEAFIERYYNRFGCIQRSATDHWRSSNAPWFPRTCWEERPCGFLGTWSFLEPM
jgi:hypothetical protein